MTQLILSKIQVMTLKQVLFFEKNQLYEILEN